MGHFEGKRVERIAGMPGNGFLIVNLCKNAKMY